MFWKKKEKILDLKIGKISLTTLNNKPEMILKEYDTMINELNSKKLNAIRIFIDNSEEIISNCFGYYKQGYLFTEEEILRNHEALHETRQFLKEFKFKDMFSKQYDKMLKVKEVIDEKKQLKLRKYKQFLM